MPFTMKRRSIGFSCALIAIRKDSAITITSGKGNDMKGQSERAGEVRDEDNEPEQAEEFVPARHAALRADKEGRKMGLVQANRC